MPFIHEETSSSRSDLSTNNVDPTGVTDQHIQAKMAIIPFHAARWVRCDKHQSEAWAKGGDQDAARYHRNREHHGA